MSAGVKPHTMFAGRARTMVNPTCQDIRDAGSGSPDPVTGEDLALSPEGNRQLFEVPGLAVHQTIVLE